jgi:hypothetical protein
VKFLLRVMTLATLGFLVTSPLAGRLAAAASTHDATIEAAADAVVPLLRVSPDAIALGGTVTVLWTGLATPSASDWIGLYQVGAESTAYLEWKYVNCSNMPGSSQSVRGFGSCLFALPGSVSPGAYQFRLLAEDGFTVVATSNVVTIMGAGPIIATPLIAGLVRPVTWSGIASPSASDWIGLYREDASDSAYLRWTYVSCSTTPGMALVSGSCMFDLNVGPGPLNGPPPGRYEFRLLSSDGFTVLATSNDFRFGSTDAVDPSISVSPPSVSPGGTLVVEWDHLNFGAVGASATDWIGLYQPGAPADAYIDWFYASCTQIPSFVNTFGSCPFVLPANLVPGTYQMRAFVQNGFDERARTTFTVTGATAEPSSR